MIRSNFEKMRRKKAFEENRNLTVRTIAEETGLSTATIQRMKIDAPERIDCRTLDVLCDYFKCGVGDLLEYVEQPN